MHANCLSIMNFACFKFKPVTSANPGQVSSPSPPPHLIRRYRAAIEHFTPHSEYILGGEHVVLQGECMEDEESVWVAAVCCAWSPHILFTVHSWHGTLGCRQMARFANPHSLPPFPRPHAPTHQEANMLP
jgi:hypothetical protein